MNEQQPQIKKSIIENKLVFIATILILLASIGYLGYKISTTGLNLDIDLKGGNQIVIETLNIPQASSLENILKPYNADVRIAKGVTTSTVIIIFGSETDPNQILKTLSDNGYDFENYSIQSVGPVLGASFLKQAQIALLLAFIFMAITVFIIFRIPMPSFYVVLAAFADITETLAVSQLLGIDLSLATFSALLLLIGYSVDTDILLTTRVLRGEGDLESKIRGAMKTGITMVGTALVALFALFIISLSPVINQIASVLIIGLLFDILNTYVVNASLLRWYMKRRGNK